MKLGKCLLFFQLLITVPLCNGGNEGTHNFSPHDWRNTISVGLPLTLNFHVTDEDGNPIEGARCEGFFQLYGKEGTSKATLTDAEGNASLTGVVNYNPVSMRFSATGFYNDRGREYVFYPSDRHGVDRLERDLRQAASQGYWSPPKEPICISLKRRGQPPIVRLSEAYIPLEVGNNQRKWFDLNTMACTNAPPVPMSDSWLEITSSYCPISPIMARTNDSYRIYLKAMDAGFVVQHLDPFSEYRYPLVAPKIGYSEYLTFSVEKKGGRIIEEKGIADGDVVIFKSSKNENFVRYAILISGSFARSSKAPFSATLKLKYFLFPAQKGNNLEFESEYGETKQGMTFSRSEASS